MKEIFQEYGGILITVVAILAIIVVITAVSGTDAFRVMGKAFKDLISSFFKQAQTHIKYGCAYGAWKRIFWATVELCGQR